VLLELGRLPSGSHLLHVITEHNRSPITASLRFAVLEPLPTSTSPSVLSVVVSPSTPKLEQLWDGTVTVEIYGPEDSNISCDISLYRDLGCAHKIGGIRFGPLKTPVSTEAFLGAFERPRSVLQSEYDEASCCVLRISSRQLGEHTLRCEREPSPCRWAVKRENQAYWVRLIEAETSNCTVTKFSTARFEKPDCLIPLSSGFFEPRYRVPDEGGLFCVDRDNYTSSVVIPPVVVRSLAGLKLHGSIVERGRCERDLGQVVRALELWNAARIVGDPFSASRKREVISFLKEWLASTLCGNDQRTGASVGGRLGELRSRIDVRNPTLSYALQRREADVASLPIAQTAEIISEIIRVHSRIPAFSLARDYGVPREQWIAEFALRLFSEPENIRLWAGQDFTSGLQCILSQGVLARLCRYSCLLRETNTDNAEELVFS
jgi:hypothetical protein